MQEVWQAFGRGDIWGALERTLGAAMAGFYGLIPVYGVSIILLTIAVRLLVWPLTSKQARSMLAMQQLQPEIKKLQAKHKGDRQKLNEEMMKYYQEKGINPLASCLPLVIQAPVLFALYRVFAPPHGSGLFLQSITHAATGGGVLCDGNIPRGIHALMPSTSALRQSLDCRVQTFLGMDLARRPADFLKVFPDVIPYVLLVALVVVSGIYSQRQMQKRTPSSAQNDQMQMIAKVMPIFFGFITLTLSAGLGVYFAVSNLWQLGQQEMIFRRQQRDGGNGAPRSSGSSGSAPLALGSRARSFLRVGGARPEAGQDGSGNGETSAAASISSVPASTKGKVASRPTAAAGKPATGGKVAGGAARGTSGGSRPADPQKNRKKRRKKGR